MRSARGGSVAVHAQPVNDPLTRTAAVRISLTRDPEIQEPQAGECSHWPPSPDHTTSMSQPHLPRRLLTVSCVFLHRKTRTKLTTAGPSTHSDEE